MCGCVSIVVPEDNKKREDYLTNDDIGYGVAYGFSKEEIDYAKSTVGDLINYYSTLEENAKLAANTFIKYCEEKFLEKDNGK